MFYQCGECNAIHETRDEAAKCCSIPIFSIEDRYVERCTNKVHDEEADECHDCQNTGWRYREAKP